MPDGQEQLLSIRGPQSNTWSS